MKAIDRLLGNIDKRRNPCIVGLDPRISQMPEHMRIASEDSRSDPFGAVGCSLVKFSRSIIDRIADVVPAIKVQIAFYEQYGSEGMRAFEEVVRHAKKKGLIVIEDAKRGDIGSTAEAYADGHLGEVELLDGRHSPSLDVDMMTVNPYFGSDCLKPFIEACERYGKGIFILDKTSNPSAGELQDRLIEGGEPLYEMVARCIDRAGRDVMGERGYSSLGAVVGATYRESAERLRSLMPKTFFLVPGFGSQGGGPEDVVPCFNEDGYGALISSSRDVIFAYRREPYADQFDPEEFDLASRQAALDMRDDVLRAMERHGKIPPSW